MASILARHWWALALRGVLAIFIGVIAVFMPGVTLFALTYLFGAYAAIDGVVSLTAAIRSARHGEHWWELVFVGIAGLAAAAFTFMWPGLTLLVLIYIVAVWAIITGVLEVAAAIRLRRVIRGEWLLIVAGIASMLFGVLLFGAPGPGAVVLAWWIGAYIFVLGIPMLGLAFRLRRWSGPLNPQHA